MSEIPQESLSTEPRETNDGRIISRRGFLTVVGGSLVGGALVATIGGYEHLKDERQSLEAGGRGQTEVLAYTKASELTAALYDSAHGHDSAQHPNSVRMTVLNGEVTSTANGENGEKKLVYENPILLAVKPTTQIDDKGSFLKDAYLGVLSNDDNGRVVINPVRYDPSRHTFTSYGNGEVTIDLAAYVTAEQAGPGRDGLIGFDPNGQKSLANRDGSPITPGLQKPR